VTEDSDTSLWRQAIEICESLSGLSREQIAESLNNMCLAPQLQEKVMRIMDNMSASNPLLDQHNYMSLMVRLKKGHHLIGKTIDGYLIKKVIAKGGMSTVYEAGYVDAKHQKSVALKLLSPYGITEKAIELFNREQLILSKLSHPAIVAFHHSGVTDDGTHYLVMEYLEGATNVLAYCTEQHLDNRQIVELIISLCEVFSYAHDKQIIHRDIKPSNVMVDKQGQVKVIDFGIGRLEQFQGQTVTHVFTPDAAAPEQLMGLSVSNQTDVFSLGALMLQLLLKNKPLPKTDYNNYDPLNEHKHIRRQLKESDLDGDLQKILISAMHIDPKLRYSDMLAFAEDLRHWLNNEPINASADGLMYRAKKLFERNKVSMTIALLLLLTGISGGVFIYALDEQKQQVINQKNNSFALLEALIDQANPLENDHPVDGDAIVRSLNELAEQQKELIASDPELTGFFYQKLGALYHSKGLYTESLHSYQKAISAMNKYMSDSSDKYLSMALTIANLLETTGAYEEAAQAGEALIAQLIKLPQAAPRHLANAYYLLGKIHQYQADNKTALEYGQRALDWLQKHPEMDIQMQATLFNSLAVINRNIGNNKKAEELYVKAIDLLKPFKEAKLEWSSIVINLAILKGRSGDLEASEDLFNQAFAVIKDIDEKHPHLAMAYLPYSTLLQVSGRLNESKAVIEKAIAMLTLNGEKKHLAMAHKKMARIGLIQFDVNVTLKHIGLAYDLLVDITGEDHPDVFDLYNMALWVLMLDPYLSEAKELIKVIDKKPAEVSSASQKYQLYLVQRDYVGQQQSASLKTDEALFPSFIFGIKSQSRDVQTQWLNHQQQLAGQSKLTQAWWQLQLAMIEQDFNDIKSICHVEAKWYNSSQLAFKDLIIQDCLSYSQQLKSNNLNDFRSRHHSINATSEHTQILIQQLIGQMRVEKKVTK